MQCPQRTMSVDTLKKTVAEAAIDHIQSGDVIGVGTGSTVDYFIAALARISSRIEGAVASSKRTAAQLQALNIPLLDLNSTGTLPLYVDGADQANQNLQLIKGGGGALTREKIIAAASSCFICVVDKTKIAEPFGTFPLAVEVIPMARSFVARELLKMDGAPRWRKDFLSDNGNMILDVTQLDMSNPLKLETDINQLTGVVASGLFAKRHADKLLVATSQGVQTIQRAN